MKISRLFLPAMVISLIAVRMTIAAGGIEVEGWGDLRGFRIDGQLFPVVTSIRVETLDSKESIFTGHWQQRDVHFSTDGAKQNFDGRFGLRRGGLFFLYKTRVEQLDANRAKIEVRVTAQQDSNIQAIYFVVHVPLPDYAGAGAELIGVSGPATRTAGIATTQPATDRDYLQSTATGVSLKAAKSSLEISFDQSRETLVHDVHVPSGDLVSVRILLHPGDVKKGETTDASFTLKFTGQVDHTPAHLAIDVSKKGSEFRGIGGNFVFSLDSPDVNYNIENFKPVWARMAVPLSLWQPVESIDPDPQKIADVDGPRSEIRTSLELARKFSEHDIPLIFTLWVPPAWAITNPVAGEPYAEGRLVNPAKWDALCNSIVLYLLYAKSQYGIEPKLFSFNETDLGVTIKLSPHEYHDTIARLGASFAAHGISTKLLIGDVSNPHPVKFIDPTLADPRVMQYAGAISYHSWNGATNAELAAWHAAAQKAGLPLFVAEGGTDSDAYRYPHVFAEMSYAIDEAATYVDTLANAQPLSILPWEMTSDYSMIDFHGPTPEPYKRFWCLKQLSATTTPGEVELQTTCDQPAIHATALVDPAGNTCAIHLVNTGAARDVAISGLPPGIGHLQTYITDADHSFAPEEIITATDGMVRLSLPALSFVTLATPK